MFATITLDTTGFSDGIKGVSKEMQQAKKNIENVGTSVKNAAKTFATIGASVGAAGTTVFAFANKISQTGDNIDKMSQKLGMSAESYQEWDYILEHCGASVDSLQSSMKTLSNAAQDGNAAFEKLGISLEDAASMSTEDLFSAVITGLQNMEEGTERTSIASDLLGRSATELGALLNTSAEATEEMRKKVHELGGVMSDEAVKNSAAFQDSLTDLKSAFSGVTNGLAAELIPKLTELMDRVTDFVASGGIENMIKGFRNMAPVISAAAVAMATFKATNAVAGVIKAVTTAADSQTLSFKALFKVLNTNPFALIATLIAAVGTALITLYTTNENFRNKVNAVWEAVKEKISSVIDTLQPLIESISDAFSNAWEAIKAVWDLVEPYFSYKWEQIKLVFSVVSEILGSYFSMAWENIKIVWDVVVDYFSTVWDSIAGIFQVVTDVLSGDFKGAWEAIKGIFSGWEDFFEGLVTSIKEIFSNIGSFFEDVGKQLLEGLWNGISDKVEWLKGKVSGVVDKIKSWFTGSEGFDEHSPSKWANKVFRYVMEGGGEGLEAGAPSLLRNVDSVVDRVKSEMDFGTASLGVTGQYSSTYSGYSAAPGGFTIGPQTFILQLPNGDALASFIVDILRGEVRMA